MQDCVKSAAAAGLKVHVWKVCWRLDRAPDDLIRQLRKDGRLQVTDKGKTIDWLCPSNPANLRMEKDAVREIVRRYPVDGIHLDYIRYPDSHSCYCKGCRTRFEAHLGKPVGHWPAPRHAILTRKRFREWRALQITRLVADLSVAIKTINPDVKLSAAVFGRYPLCVASVGQDWREWLERGYVDFVCPMDYTDDLGKFRDLVTTQLATAATGPRIFPGIGVTAAESRLDAISVLKQINELQARDAGGFMLFDLNPVLEREIFPALARGITAAKK
ncbi:hypothetical protein ES703_120762 [subsurface metagenome]